MRNPPQTKIFCREGMYMVSQSLLGFYERWIHLSSDSIRRGSICNGVLLEVDPSLIGLHERPPHIGFHYK
eukprot:8917046-Pyramimonas_sp.AAC.1